MATRAGNVVARGGQEAPETVRPTSSEEADAGSARGAAMGTGLRICSLLPSATEIVLALGLGDRLVAVTHECDYPPAATRLAVITRSTLAHGVRHSRALPQQVGTAL